MSWSLSLAELLKATQGQLLNENQTVFSGVTTDGRKENKDKVFFALKGERFDAHDFLEQVAASGAAAVVVHQDVKITGVTIIKVQDTLKALQSLASFWRHKQRAKILAITGSNGKTSTKDFATTLISSKFKTKSTVGNLNNFIGLPKSLLSLDDETQVGVFEMGLSIPNEIALLTDIADPDVSVITTVGRAHLEGLGGIEAVAANKEPIYSHAKPEATRIYNLDNPLTRKMKERAPRESKILTFSMQDPKATVSFRETVSNINFLEISGTIDGEPGSAKIPIFGRHNISNLMVASALALAAGVEPDLIWKSLPHCKGYWGRNQIVKLKSGAIALFDAYNANPDSVEALLSNVSRLKLEGKLFGVFGDMLELGPESRQMHVEWGRLVAEQRFDHVWFIGSQGEAFAEGMKGAGFKKNIIISKGYEESLAHDVRNMLNPHDIVLVKGSRGMKLERVVLELDPVDFSR